MTYIVCLQSENDDYGVYCRARLLFRGPLVECCAFRRQRNI